MSHAALEAIWRADQRTSRESLARPNDPITLHRRPGAGETCKHNHLLWNVFLVNRGILRAVDWAYQSSAKSPPAVQATAAGGIAGVERAAPASGNFARLGIGSDAEKPNFMRGQSESMPPGNRIDVAEGTAN